jgi:O-antigen/teichoic acid export membrane protein
MLTRLYTPAAFGYFAVIAGIVGIVATVASGRYEQAVLIPDSDDDAWNLAAAATSLSVLVSGASLLILVLIDWLRLLPGVPRPLLYVVPAGVLLYAVLQTLTYCANRQRLYKAMARNRVAQAAVSAGTQVSLGVFIPDIGAGGLLAGMLAGYVTAVVLLAAKVGIHRWLQSTIFSWSNVMSQASRHRAFLFYSMPNALANSASRQVPNVLLATLFGAGAAGQYSLGYRLVSAPLGLLGNAVGTVFFQTSATQQAKKKHLQPLVSATYKRLFMVGLAPFAVLLLTAPDLFAIVFGVEWRIAGQYTQVLTPWLLMMFLNSPVVPVLAVLGRQKALFRYEMLLLAARGLAIYIGASLFGNAYVAVSLFGAVGFIFNSILFLYINRVVRCTDNDSKGP